MKWVNGYLRETPEDAGMVIDKSWPDVGRGAVVLRDVETGKRELWQRSPSYAGAAIVIEGMTYEFVRSLPEVVR